MKSVLPLAVTVLFAGLAHAQTDAPVITRAPITADEKSAASTANPAELADLSAQNKKLSNELALAWKENDRLKTYALGQVATANQKAEAAEAQNASATNALVQNQADLDAKNKEVAALNAQLADAQKSIDDLRKTAAASDPNALATAQNDLAAQTQKVADLEAARADLAQKLAQAQAAATAAPAAAPTESSDLQMQAADPED